MIGLMIFQSAHSQNCQQDLFEFNTQTAVDSLPECPILYGDVRIDSDLQDPITNLDAFSNVEQIRGRLYIVQSRSLSDIEGFANLQETEELHIGSGNDSLQLNNAFPSLQMTGSLRIINSDGLHSMEGAFPNLKTVSELRIVNNEGLKTMSGSFASLDSILVIDGSSGNLDIWENYSLDTLSGFENLKYVQSSIRISNNDSTRVIDGFDSLNEVGDDLEITSHDTLLVLSGFPSLENIVGNLDIVNNQSLKTIDGFANLNSLSELVMYTNHSLESLEAFNELQQITGFTISLSHALESISGFQKLHSLEYLSFSGNRLQSIDAFSQLKNAGRLSIGSCPELNHIAVFDSLNYISGDLGLSQLPMLTNLSAFSKLKEVQGDVRINSCNGLETLAGLDSLKHIGTNLELYDNDQLKSVQGLEQLQDIQGNLTIWSHNTLESLQALSNLERIGHVLNVKNCPMLVSLEAFENINLAFPFEIRITDCPMIQDCDYDFICELALLSSERVFVKDNGANCRSLDDVHRACGYLLPHECVLYSVTLDEDYSMDTLQYYNPDCTVVSGDLRIEDGFATSATDSFLEYIGGDVEIYGLYSYTLPGCAKIDSIGGDLIINASRVLVGAIGFNSLEKIKGSLSFVSAFRPSSLNGLSELKRIEKNFLVENSEISSFEGLQNLQSIGGYVNIIDNEGFSDFAGLNGLEVIEGGVHISDNLDLESFAGLESLYAIDGQLHIYRNDSLVNLAGLAALQVIDGQLHVVENPLLESLEGFENLDIEELGGVQLIDNINLSLCSTSVLCPWFEASPDLSTVYGNREGCSNLDEIALLCEQLPSNLMQTSQADLYLFPNPAKDLISLDGITQESISLRLFDEHGRLLRSTDVPNKHIDVTDLTEGFYFLLLQQADGRLIKRKFLIQGQ